MSWHTFDTLLSYLRCARLRSLEEVSVAAADRVHFRSSMTTISPKHGCLER